MAASRRTKRTNLALNILQGLGQAAFSNLGLTRKLYDICIFDMIVQSSERSAQLSKTVIKHTLWDAAPVEVHRGRVILAIRDQWNQLRA